jgi:hypothetical protein
MNCQYCGKKIGILENWRYGRFCSKEHQDEFREEAGRLATSVLQHRMDRPQQGAGQESGAARLFATANSGDPNPAEEVDPPEMGTVDQFKPLLAKWKPAPQTAARPAGERDLRLFKILASANRMPPVLEKDSRRKLPLPDAPYRFGEVTARGARSVLVPPSGAVQRRPKLMLFDALFPLDWKETNPPLPEFGAYWQGEAAWNPDGMELVAMDYGDFPGPYAPEAGDAPWDGWDWDTLFEEAKVAQAATEEREKRRNEVRSQKDRQPQTQPAMPQGAPAPAAPAGTGRPAGRPAGAYAMPGPGVSLPAMPVPGFGNVSRAVPPGAAHHGMPQGRAPGHAPNSAGTSQPGAGSAIFPAMPAYPGRMVLRPVGSGGAPAASPRQPAVPGSPMAHTAPGSSVPMEWVELAPPLFLALCKIDDPEPAKIPVHARQPESAPLAEESEAAFTATAGLIESPSAGPLRVPQSEQLAIEAPKPMNQERRTAGEPPSVGIPKTECELPHRLAGTPAFALPPSCTDRAVLTLRVGLFRERPETLKRVAG